MCQCGRTCHCTAARRSRPRRTFHLLVTWHCPVQLVRVTKQRNLIFGAGVGILEWLELRLCPRRAVHSATLEQEGRTSKGYFAVSCSFTRVKAHSSQFQCQVRLHCFSRIGVQSFPLWFVSWIFGWGFGESQRCTTKHTHRNRANLQINLLAA